MYKETAGWGFAEHICESPTLDVQFVFVCLVFFFFFVCLFIFPLSLPFCYFYKSLFVWFLSDLRIESLMFGIITGGVLSVCNFVVKMLQRKKRKEKKKKKRNTGPVSFLLSLTGVSGHEIIHFCISTALKADMLLLVSKDMLSIPWHPPPPVFICLISFFTERESVYWAIWTWQ